MDQRTTQILFSLLRSAIRGTKLTQAEIDNYSPEMLPKLLEISRNHDVAHLLAWGLKQNGLITKDDSEVEKSILTAIFRCEQNEYEYENLCGVLEKAKIPFIPLKGAVIRKYYPEAWMRTTCDIDVFVAEDDFEKARSVLVDECSYIYHGKGSHDISLFSPTNVHVELHFDLVEDGIANNSSKILKSVWDTSLSHEGYVYWHEMSNEMYYFYHIAHMAKHFIKGGCGIRPFIDLWIMKENVFVDSNVLRKLFDEAHLTEFYNAICEMVDVWFDNKPYTDVALVVEEYVIKGGVYGTVNNAVVVSAASGASKAKSIFNLIFMSRENLMKVYPKLEQYPILYPFYQVKRWFRVFNRKKRNKVKHLIDIQNSVTKKEINSTADLLNRIGLNDSKKNII